MHKLSVTRHMKGFSCGAARKQKTVNGHEHENVYLRFCSLQTGVANNCGAANCHKSNIHTWQTHARCIMLLFTPIFPLITASLATNNTKSWVNWKTNGINFVTNILAFVRHVKFMLCCLFTCLALSMRLILISSKNAGFVNCYIKNVEFAVFSCANI